MKLNLHTDCGLIRAAAGSTRYVWASFTASLRAQDAGSIRASRIPVNVSLVLDRSGSMGGQKIVLARRAVEQALRMLHPDDRFSLVIYDTEIDVLVASTRATNEAKGRALELVGTVRERGGTDLGAGWLSGCEQVATHTDANTVNRCLLLTDGLANHGIADREVLARHAAELWERGVQTSTFGVGSDFDERLLRDMAAAGGGHFYFLESPIQIPDLITSELGEALDVVVCGATLEITLPRGASAEPLHRYRTRRIDGDNEVHVELGDLVSGQDVNVLVRLDFPAGVDGESVCAGFALADREQARRAPRMELVWTWASDEANDVQVRDQEVDRRVAELYAARARAEATERNREGEFELARRTLAETVRRIRAYAGSDAAMNGVAEGLEGEQQAYAVAMSPAMLKESFFRAAVAVTDRDSSGKARRKR